MSMSPKCWKTNPTVSRRNSARSSLRASRQVTTLDHDLARLRPLESAEDRQESRLARPGRAHESQVGPPAGRQLDVFQDREGLPAALVGVRQPAYADGFDAGEGRSAGRRSERSAHQASRRFMTSSRAEGAFLEPDLEQVGESLSDGATRTDRRDAP